jgi:hypothetical protein
MSEELDIDDPDEVATYATAYGGVLTGIGEQTSTAVSGVAVPAGSSLVDRLGTQLLSWTTANIGEHAREMVTRAAAATEGVVAGARAIAGTDADGATRVSAQVVL